MTRDLDHRDFARAMFVDAIEHLHHRCRYRVRHLCFDRLRSVERIGEDGESSLMHGRSVLADPVHSVPYRRQFVSLYTKRSTRAILSI